MFSQESFYPLSPKKIWKAQIEKLFHSEIKKQFTKYTENIKIKLKKKLINLNIQK